MTTCRSSSSTFTLLSALAVGSFCISVFGTGAVADASAASPAIDVASLMQDNYKTSLQHVLQETTHYPNGRVARQLHPHGTVGLWIELDRGGAFRGAGIEKPSGSPLLDREAVQMVRRGRYPAMPSEAFPGQVSQRFSVPIDFVADRQT
jgi:protein TonB